MKYLKKILLAVLLFLLFFILIRGIPREKNGKNEYFAQINGQRINVYRTEDAAYLFVPAYANPDEIVYSEGALELDTTRMKLSEIPTVFIQTQTGTMDKIHADKDYMESGKITIYDLDGSIAYFDGLQYIKGHGNYSWNNEMWRKKPYKISFKDGSGYTLIANASDPTLLRNHIGRELETVLRIPYANEGDFVSLYINGDYYGIYYLCKNLDVDRNYYLMEREFYDRFALESDKKKGFMTEDGECFVIVKPSTISEKEIDSLSQRMNEIDESIRSLKDIDQNVDMDSFAKRYVVEEVMKNYDAGISSAYFYLNANIYESKLFYGPGWDYDMSLGNYLDWMSYSEEDATGLTLGVSEGDVNEWPKLLYENQDFRKLAITNYEEGAKSYLEELTDSKIQDYADLLRNSARADSIRWREMYELCGYEILSDQSIEELTEFITERTAFLDTCWGVNE